MRGILWTLASVERAELDPDAVADRFEADPLIDAIGYRVGEICEEHNIVDAVA
jgi:hypothetical protein